MVKHHLNDESWWCLPGGAVDLGEIPAEAALRELNEECGVDGTIIQQTSHLTYSPEDESATFLIDIGNQNPVMGSDPEFHQGDQIIIDMQWLLLNQIPERDRAYLWAAGLLAVPVFFVQVESWGDTISFPGKALLFKREKRIV